MKKCKVCGKPTPPLLTVKLTDAPELCVECFCKRLGEGPAWAAAVAAAKRKVAAAKDGERRSDGGL